MQRFIFLSSVLLLAGCSTPDSVETTGEQVSDLLLNPLYVERYGDEIVNSMVNLHIYKDPLLEDSAKADIVEHARAEWLERSDEATDLQREGQRGQILTMKEYAKGEVLYVGDTLHFGPDFEATPGPQLHVFLTTVVDPRDVPFPDKSSIDLGLLHTPYGSQSYPVSGINDPMLYRTVVLWDTALDRLYGFAQIQ